MESLELLKKLSEVDGVSGHEHDVANLLATEGKPYADEVTFDKLGSVLLRQNGEQGEPVIMLAGHMDEVGFLVSRIEDSGYLRLHPLGGWWTHVLLAEIMTVKTQDGRSYIGVTCAEPPHGLSPEMRSKTLDIKDIFVDMGVRDKKMIEDMGIRVGDTVTPKTDFRILNDGKTLLGKAWDDRLGVAVAIEVLKRLHNEKHRATYIAAGTVQEEVGLRGAKTAAYAAHPDIAFAVDVTMSYDLPGSPNNPTKLGTGVALSLLDGSVIAHRGLFDFVEKIAKEKHIKYTYDLLTNGGTDSGEIHCQYDGVITMTISLPCRYFHSHVSLIHYDHYLAAVELMCEVIKAMDKNVLQSLKDSKYC